MTEPVLGLLTGVLFGFLMQKGGVLRFDRQVGLLLFKDMTLVKFFFSTILVGSVGMQLLADAKLVVPVCTTLHAGVVVGGVIFGLGWALAGYCPGTVVGALGEGRWDALFVIAGMVCGAGLYAVCYPWLRQTVLAWPNVGALNLSGLTGLSPWHGIALLWGAGIVSFVWCGYKRL